MDYRDVWREFAEEFGGKFELRGWGPRFLKNPEWRVPAGRWVLVIGTRAVATGDLTSVRYTTMRLRFVAPNGLPFTISPGRPMIRPGPRMRFRGILELDDPAFEQAFIVDSNDIGAVQMLLDDAPLQHSIQTTLTRGHFACQDVRRLRPGLPRGLRELRYTELDYVADRDRLRALRSMLLLTMDRLVAIGAATQDDPRSV